MNRWIRGIWCAALLLLTIYAASFFIRAHLLVRHAEEELAELRRTASEMWRENGYLAEQVAALSEDGAMEAIAREQLGLVRPEDRIYLGENEN